MFLLQFKYLAAEAAKKIAEVEKRLQVSSTVSLIMSLKALDGQLASTDQCTH